MKYILAFTILLFISACNNAEKPPIDSSKVILSAEVLSYKDLTEGQKAEIKYGCYCYPNNWRDGVEFSKESSYFVSCKINNNLLAQLCESETFQIKDLLNENANMLYGKYHNSWVFTDSLGYKVCETSKFEGQNTISLQRKGEIDDLLIGPLIEKPKVMSIEIANSKYYKDNPDPSFKLK
ncbi:MAG TPA: hypothetical protein PK776_08330 [Flavobacterium sp.]|nr:hypothetical protein [Flavobacterium sp.]